MKIIYTDVLVVGAGLAGLRCATGVKERGHDVVVLTLVPPKRSHSAAAQGGMQSSIANGIMGEGDNEDVHFEDTVKGSDWMCDQDVARLFVNTSPKAVRELAAWGVPWTRIKKGPRQVVINTEKVTITEKDEAHGLINARDFGGTKKWRTCYTSDGTGHSMLYAMDDKRQDDHVPVHERMEMIALIHENGRCYGCVARNLMNGELVAYIAKATIVATGGYGRIYQISTNAVICQGVAHGVALDTGIATLGNMEAVQFHPTGIVPAGILVTEGCRGDGGVLRDKDGYRFMPDYEPQKKDLASRDVVSRRMTEHMRKGKGVESKYGEHLWLDITILGREHIEKNLREVQEICENFLGIDPAEEYIPVRPTQHYSMGGIRTKYTGESETLPGLWSIGEAACWDLHGFNRLGGNSVAETVVSGMLAAEHIADFCDTKESEITISTETVKRFLDEQKAYLQSFLDKENGEDSYQIRKEMEECMMEHFLVFRNGPDMERGVNKLKELYERSKNIEVKTKELGVNPELFNAYRIQKMLKVALCVAYGALMRTESRGAHSREDYPERNDKEWLKRTIATWPDPDQNLPTLTYQELDIQSMELPPGFRGYGKDLTIPNEKTAGRQAEVDKIKEEMGTEGKDRFEIQNVLMPFWEKLPEVYRKKNERITERFDD